MTRRSLEKAGCGLMLGCLLLACPARQQAQEKPPAEPAAHSAARVAALLEEARKQGDARRGAAVFGAAQFACLSCHQIGKVGGTVGPALSEVGKCLPAEEIVEAVLWPKHKVKPEFVVHAILTADGKSHQGYKQSENDKELVLRDPASGKSTTLAKADIEARREVGTLMPDGLTAAMSVQQRRDLIRFLIDLGREKDVTGDNFVAHVHVPAAFEIKPAPLQPEHWPNLKQPINRDRLYDFYAREADHFRVQTPQPRLLPEFPGLDGPRFGHWGSQNEATWSDARWNNAELGSVMCGVFRGNGLTVPRGVCIRLGERGEQAACFNPDTLCYEALWQGGFVKFSAVRHGFMDGLLMDGKALPRPEGQRPEQPFVYRGFHRRGNRVLFAYRIGDTDYLDAPWVEDGQFKRVVAPAVEHPLRDWTKGGPPQWPQELATRGLLGQGGPYVVDTIRPPFDNPWKVPLFFGDHDFLSDGTALICTMQGDVWRVSGLDDKLERVVWRRFASGLHQALGLLIADKQIYVLGRNQLTRLHDVNDDGEADHYECFSNAFISSPAGHDFICGLQRDAAGNFYTASGNQGIVRISADGKTAKVLATGFRNPDGLGLLPDGTLTVPCSEGDWTPASMICALATGKDEKSDVPHFGAGGPRQNRPPEVPLVYLPRGVDNSSGGQVHINSDRWGPLQGQAVHLSYGACSHFLLLRDSVAGQQQGAIVPLPGDFASGVHRGRFNPKDGQLYVSGMAGWGTYASEDGCFQRVRYTGQTMQLPVAVRVRENGVLVEFAQPVDAATAAQAKSHFAQAWNYRYSAGYGSPEFSPSHPGTRGHDVWPIASAHVLADRKTLFLEIPDLQPVNQLHLRLRVDGGPPHDVFATVHKLGQPFADFPGYKRVEKLIAAHPILADMATLNIKPQPNPWRKVLPSARGVRIETGKNLTFATTSFKVKAGETIQLTFTNPDVVPHNWVLVKPGSLERVGDLANRIIAEPDAVVRQYVPRSEDVVAYTDVVQPQNSFAIYFTAPTTKGRYPYLCTFPGHWMVMNGQMIVE